MSVLTREISAIRSSMATTPKCSYLESWSYELIATGQSGADMTAQVFASHSNPVQNSGLYCCTVVILTTFMPCMKVFLLASIDNVTSSNLALVCQSVSLLSGEINREHIRIKSYTF